MAKLTSDEQELKDSITLLSQIINTDSPKEIKESIDRVDIRYKRLATLRVRHKDFLSSINYTKELIDNKKDRLTYIQKSIALYNNLLKEKDKYDSFYEGDIYLQYLTLRENKTLDDDAIKDKLMKVVVKTSISAKDVLSNFTELHKLSIMHASTGYQSLYDLVITYMSDISKGLSTNIKLAGKSSFEEQQKELIVFGNAEKDRRRLKIPNKHSDRIKYFQDWRNMEQFCIYYFATKTGQFSPWGYFHKEAIKNLFGPNAKQNHMWEWHRGSAKSILSSLYVPLWLAMNKRLYGMILMSANENKAQDLLRAIAKNLELNKRLLDDYGPILAEGTIRQQHVRYKFKKSGHHFGIWAYGAKQSPAGVRSGANRPNLIVVDDIDTLEIAKNKDLVDETLDKINNHLKGCWGKATPQVPNLFIFSNNRITPNGITAGQAKLVQKKIQESADGEKLFFYSQVSVTEDPKTHKSLIYTDERAQPAWKEHFTQQGVKDLILSMADNWLQELYHVPGKTDKRFKLNWIKYEKINEAIKFSNFITYCDPAFTENEKSDFTAMVALGGIRMSDYTYRVYVLDMYHLKTSSPVVEYLTWCDHIYRGKWASYITGGTKINNVFEAMGSAKSMIENLIEKNKGYNFGHSIPGFAQPEVKTNNAEKDLRISTISAPMRNGQIIFSDDLRETDAMNAAIEEFRVFPYNRHDDMIDAIATGFGWLIPKESKATVLSTKGGFRYGSVYGKPIGTVYN